MNRIFTILKYNVAALLPILLVISVSSCHNNNIAGAKVFEPSFINEQFNDSLLLQALKDDINNKTIVSLYYNCQFTDDWTDNTCYTENNPVVSGNLSANYDAGWNQFDKIRKCNVLIKNISSVNILSSTTKQTWKGELLFLRGMVYYYLAQRFGGLQLDSTNVVHKPAPARRSSLQETYDFIMNDFTMSALLLPEFTNAERPSKIAALAMLTRTGLQAAAYVHEKRVAYLQLVIESAEKIIQTKARNLDSNYYSLFNDFNKSKTSREMILAIYKNGSAANFAETNMYALIPNQTNEKRIPGYGPELKNDFQCWPVRFPSQNLVNAFLTTNEKGEIVNWNETTGFKNFKSHTDFVSSILYKNRDKRFYATIVHDSSSYFHSMALTRDSGNLNYYSRPATNWGGLSPTRYYYRKFVYEVTKNAWPNDSTNHHQTILRMGEVWLNYAEANLLMGNYEKTTKAINQTRMIHGGLSPFKFSDTADIWKVYKNERRVELCLENDRYWSLLRWAKFEKRNKIPELEEKIQGISIDADGKDYKIFDVNPGEKRIFLAKRFLFPLPASAGELAKNNNNTEW